ncbi:unnamed protein product [Protopolystoma xenopodis]|uniref:Uncharacterized protein n=1 Tax=Protopolystoma xenopodis TaxID=117903 RepID=A0A448XDB2_9PLAT|nr:unnamed protein product [Protopolystoma xenopodis]
MPHLKLGRTNRPSYNRSHHRGTAWQLNELIANIGRHAKLESVEMHRMSMAVENAAQDYVDALVGEFDAYVNRFMETPSGIGFSEQSERKSTP